MADDFDSGAAAWNDGLSYLTPSGWTSLIESLASFGNTIFQPLGVSGSSNFGNIFDQGGVYTSNPDAAVVTVSERTWTLADILIVIGLVSGLGMIVWSLTGKK
ncbi:MAG: hypothetical protein ACPGO3_13320 [Magnetospiraceae bacterium]